MAPSAISDNIASKYKDNNIINIKDNESHKLAI